MSDARPDIDPNLAATDCAATQSCVTATDPAAVRHVNQQLIAQFRATGGKLGDVCGGRPVLLLTTVGAKSGAPRTSPLNYMRDGDRFVVLCSQRVAGAPTNPAWYQNLIAHPTATVEVGDETFEAKATITDGAERDRLLSALASRWPMLANLPQETARRVPVIVLEPVDN